MNYLDVSVLSNILYEKFTKFIVVSLCSNMVNERLSKSQFDCKLWIILA